MTAFEIPTVATERLRAFRAGDFDAFVAMQANPEVMRYAITEAGRDELMAWLWELTSEPASEYPAFAAPLMFIYALGRDRAIAALAQRGARLEADISASDAYRRAYLEEMPGFPRIFTVEDEYAQAMRRAELAWGRAMVTGLRDGTFPWPDIEELEKEGYTS